MTNKLIQSINYGTLNFAIFESEYNGKPIKNYSLSKKEFNKETNTSINVGNIGVNKFQDLSVIKFLLKNCLVKDKTVNPYGTFKNENTIHLVKFYTDKENNDKQQVIELLPSEVLAMLDLIERVLAINIKPISLKEKQQNIDKQAIVNSDIPYDQLIDEDIPF